MAVNFLNKTQRQCKGGNGGILYHVRPAIQLLYPTRSAIKVFLQLAYM
jgi:hypothetical protein